MKNTAKGGPRRSPGREVDATLNANTKQPLVPPVVDEELRKAGGGASLERRRERAIAGVRDSVGVETERVQAWQQRAGVAAVREGGREGLRAPVAHLPEIRVKGIERPVIHLRKAGEKKLIYALRLTGSGFRPPVFDPGATYDLTVGDPDQNLSRVLKNLKPASKDSAPRTVKF